MLPIWQAQTYEKTIESGGRNKPWVVTLQTDEGLKPYVVKMFAERDIEQQNALCKEVYGAAYARELDLNTPDFCLVEFPDYFAGTLSEDLKVLFRKKHHRYAFGSLYYEGASTYSPSQHFRDLSSYDIESIYAFDVTIRNVDRRVGKPNILFFEKQAYLIDHELSFSIKQGDNPEQVLGTFPYQKHIFHNVLSKRMKRGRNKPDFSSFMEIFRYSRTDCIMECADVLKDLGYNTDDSLVIELYLKRLRSERNKLMQRLVGSLQ